MKGATGKHEVKGLAIQETDGASLRVYGYLPIGTVAPNVDEKVSTKEWVSYGKDNQFLERMGVLADNSVTLGMCIAANALYLAGREMVINKLGKDGKMVPHDEAIAKYKALLSHDGEANFRYQTMLDVALGHARGWHFRYMDGGELSNVDHVDLSAIRSGKPNPDSDYKNKVDAYWISADWKRYTRPGFEPKRIPRYDPKKKANGRETGQLQYVFRYKMGRRFYGEPLWMPCIADAQVDSRVAPYNRQQIDSGFTPTVIVKYTGKLTPAQASQLQRDLERYFTGARGGGVMVITGTMGDQYEIIPLDANTHAGQLDAIRKAAKLEIVGANQIPAILANIDVSSGAVSNQPSIRQQVQRYERSFIEPMQSVFYEEPWKEILAQWYTDIAELYIDPIAPFDEAADEVQQRQSYIRVITRNEHRRTIGLEPLMIAEIGEDGKPGKQVPDPRGNELIVETPGASVAEPENDDPEDDKKEVKKEKQDAEEV